jgi:hypothetical protein
MIIIIHHPSIIEWMNVLFKMWNVSSYHQPSPKNGDRIYIVEFGKWKVVDVIEDEDLFLCFVFFYL